MIFAKQKITFDQFLYFATTQIFETYETNKEAVIDKAQWENTYRLAQLERDKLWEDFMFFIPLGLGIYAIRYFKGEQNTHDIFERVTGAYCHYLRNNKKLNEKQLEIFFDKMLAYFEKSEEITIGLEENGDNSINDLIPNLGIAFTNIYSKEDRTIEQIRNQVNTKNSDKMFTALKLCKTYLIKGGILDKLYKNFNITW